MYLTCQGRGRQNTLFPPDPERRPRRHEQVRETGLGVREGGGSGNRTWEGCGVFEQPRGPRTDLLVAPWPSRQESDGPARAALPPGPCPWPAESSRASNKPPPTSAKRRITHSWGFPKSPLEKQREPRRTGWGLGPGAPFLRGRKRTVTVTTARTPDTLWQHRVSSPQPASPGRTLTPGL